jgi:opine dehydrogenase
MKIAVLGAGNGGQALAGYLSLKGFSVNLYNRSEKRINCIKREKGIQLRGLVNRFAPLTCVTTRMKKALEGVTTVMVVVPAQAHKFIANMCAPHLLKGQTIVLNPGRTGGALEFCNTLKNQGLKEKVYVAEAQTFLFVSRATEKHVTISGVKNTVPVAAFPSSDTGKVVRVLKKIHPSFEKAQNVLETGLNNIGAVFHPSTMIFNAGRIESEEKFGYYVDGITPHVATFLEELDNERRMVARAFKVKTISTKNWLRAVYNAQGNSLYELIQDNGKYRKVGSPGTLAHRYIFEDIPTGLVPMASLGNHVGVKTPVIDTVIDIASQFYRTDFRKGGRTVKSLGLQGKDRHEIINYVGEGA